MFVFSDQESNCFKIVKMILERKFAPVIVFSFSKKDCEAYAMQMTKLDFNTGMSPFKTEPTNYNFIVNELYSLFLKFSALGLFRILETIFTASSIHDDYYGICSV